jgi:hypothetical protein
MNEIYDIIVNQKQNQQVYIGTVDDLDPLLVSLYPGDTSIPAVSITDLHDIAVGSRVVLLRFNKQYIAIGIVGDYYTDPTVIPAIRYKYKTSNFQVLNNTTLQDDPDLVAELEADSIFEVDAVLGVYSPTTVDCKVDWTVSGGLSQLTLRYCFGPSLAVTDNTDSGHIKNNRANLNTAQTYGGDNANTGTVYEKFLVQTSTTGGTLQLRFAQNTANATYPAQLTGGSYIKITKINAF